MDPHIVLSLFHIFLVVPLFLYVAFQRAAIPSWLYTAILILGVIILAYHGYKAMIRARLMSPSLWINLLHVFYVAPLLIYVGYYGKNTPRPAYELMAMVGFAALGYHLYNLILSINTIQDATD